MKKKSILLTCIVAVMALAMFVGCDNAPVLPSFVVGGNAESGDFLAGQTFDPGRFSVRVDYDNGKKVENDATAKVVFNDENKNGKVDFGETATVTYGISYEGDPVREKVTLNVYSIKNLAVTAPEVNEDAAAKLRPEDITVVATYLDSANAEKTMTLTSSEYSIDTAVNYVGNAPSSAEPQVQAYYNVIPSVGIGVDGAKVYGKLYFTAEFEPSKVYTADDILAIGDISAKSSLKLYAFDYDYVPRPSFDDVNIYVKYKDVQYPHDAGNDNWVEWDILTENIEGLDLMYVDEKGLPLSAEDLTGVSTLKMRAVLGDLRAESSTEVTLKTIEVNIEAADSFKASALYTDTALPAINATDFVVTYTDNVDSIKDYVPAEDLVLVYGYYETVDKIVEVQPGTVVKAPNMTISVFAKYHGVISETGVVVGTTKNRPTPDPAITGIEATLVQGAALPAKMLSYNETGLTKALGIVAGGSVKVTPVYDIEDEDNLTTVAPTRVRLSTSAEKFVQPVATSFTGEDPLYILVEYDVEGEDEKTTTFVDAIDIADSLTASYATELEVSYGYSMVTEATKDSDVASQVPMIDATIVDFQVEAVNDDGVVAILDDYRFLDEENNFIEFDPSEYEVTEKASDPYKVTALLETETGRDYVTSAAFTFKAGESWIDFDSIVDNLEFTLAAGYDNRVGQKISAKADDYEIVAESYADAVHGTFAEDSAPITITKVEIVDDGAQSPAGKLIEATGNSVIFTVTYEGKDGEISDSVEIEDVWTFDGVSYIDLDGDNFTFQYLNEESGEYEEISSFDNGTAYKVENLKLAGYTAYGDVTVPGFTVYDTSYGKKSEVSAEFTAQNGHVYTIEVEGYTAAVETSSLEEAPEGAMGKYVAVENTATDPIEF